MVIILEMLMKQDDNVIRPVFNDSMMLFQGWDTVACVYDDVQSWYIFRFKRETEIGKTRESAHTKESKSRLSQINLTCKNIQDL